VRFLEYQLCLAVVCQVLPTDLKPGQKPVGFILPTLKTALGFCDKGRFHKLLATRSNRFLPLLSKK